VNNLYKVLDLFSGLGGFSSAFWDDDDCQVIRVDNDPRFDPTILIDINKTQELISILQGWGHSHFDVILASPPCVEFYKVDKPWCPDHYGKKPDMSLLLSTMEIINHFQPPIYVIENSKHGKKWISAHLIYGLDIVYVSFFNTSDELIINSFKPTNHV